VDEPWLGEEEEQDACAAARVAEGAACCVVEDDDDDGDLDLDLCARPQAGVFQLDADGRVADGGGGGGGLRCMPPPAWSAPAPCDHSSPPFSPVSMPRYPSVSEDVCRQPPLVLSPPAVGVAAGEGDLDAGGENGAALMHQLHQLQRAQLHAMQQIHAAQQHQAAVAAGQLSLQQQLHQQQQPTPLFPLPLQNLPPLRPQPTEPIGVPNGCVAVLADCHRDDGVAAASAAASRSLQQQHLLQRQQLQQLHARDRDRSPPAQSPASSSLSRPASAPTTPRRSPGSGSSHGPISPGGGASCGSGNPRYTLMLDKVRSGGDMRTSLMIRNIPNKYSAKMMLAALEEDNCGRFDFLYYPLDFKNNCGVGYAFINFTAPRYIVPFYLEFHGRKWPKFNSDKVCEITYARIQGKQQLVNHFSNSSLMNEDPKCRPLVFGADGRQEEFPVGLHVRTRRGPSARDTKAHDTSSSPRQHIASSPSSPPYSPGRLRGRCN
jgi:RNA recognition motif 2